MAEYISFIYALLRGTIRDQEVDLAQHIAPSRSATFYRAMSYGPFSYGQTAAAGLTVATAVFLVCDAFVRHHDVTQELPLFLALAGAAVVVVLLVATIANYVLGRQVLDEVEYRRHFFAQGTLPPPMPRPEFPQIDLLPANGQSSGRFPRDRAA